MLRLRWPFAQLGEHVTRIIVACRLWEVLCTFCGSQQTIKSFDWHKPHTCRTKCVAHLRRLEFRSQYVHMCHSHRQLKLHTCATEHSTAPKHMRAPRPMPTGCACVRYAHHSKHRILTLGSAGCDRAAGDSWTSWTLASVSGRFSSPAFSSRRASDSWIWDTKM